MKTNPNDLAMDGRGDHQGMDPEQFKNFGLTKREHFAGLAMQGLSCDKFSSGNYKECGGLAERSVELADALIEALNSPTLGEK